MVGSSGVIFSCLEYGHGNVFGCFIYKTVTIIASHQTIHWAFVCVLKHLCFLTNFLTSYQL